MNRHRSIFLAATTAAALLTAAPPAFADDASLFNAYVARQASEVDPASDAYSRAVRKVRRAKTARAYVRRLRAVIRADRHINAVLSVVEGELMAQTASTANGSRARRQGLREVRAWRRANRYEIRAIKGIINGRRAQYRRWIRRGNRTILKSYRYGRRAVRRFRAAGLTSPERAITWIT
jgi:Ni/Co efflux regulator RcnB